MALAREGELLLTGLTRHLIQGRALRTNFPLSELSDTLEAKNAPAGVAEAKDGFKGNPVLRRDDVPV